MDRYVKHVGLWCENARNARGLHRRHDSFTSVLYHIRRHEHLKREGPRRTKSSYWSVFKMSDSLLPSPLGVLIIDTFPNSSHCTAIRTYSDNRELLHSVRSIYVPMSEVHTDRYWERIVSTTSTGSVTVDPLWVNFYFPFKAALFSSTQLRPDRKSVV